MNVPSLTFLLFALVGAVVYSISSHRAWRQAVLLATNITFFATFWHGSVLGFVPFTAFLLLGYFALHNAVIRIAGWLVVAAILAAFFWLKRYTFVPDQALIAFPYVTVGLSYVFFRVLHLAIDARQGAAAQRPGLVSYVNYTLNFPCLVSGPIQRYEDYRRVETNPSPLGVTGLGASIERIAIGMFKVFVLSAPLLALQRQAIGHVSDGDRLTQLTAGVATLAIYPLYLYLNFSGYTDVVIGVARWYGLVLPENFNRPFQSENFINFWSRWHITLSTWLKTYVYQPLLLGLMTRFPSRQSEPAIVVVALFVTFFLVGAWHGQTMTFLFFGVLQGSGVALNRLYQMAMIRTLGKKRYYTLCADPFYRAVARGLTFTWFAFTLLWFWSSWAQLGQCYTSLGPGLVAFSLLVLVVISTAVLSAWAALFERVRSLRVAGQPVLGSRYTRTVYTAAMVTLVAGVILVLDAPAPPIVYQKF